MAQPIIMKRSSIRGKVPVLADLDLGQIAVNTADGRMYLRNTATNSIVKVRNSADLMAGNIILSASPNYSAPYWLQANGNTYSAGIYPKLDAIYGASVGSWNSATRVLPQDVNPVLQCNGVAWSPDETILAIASSASPYLYLYQKSGTNLYKLVNPSQIPTGAAFGVSWSSDGGYLAVAHDVTPFVTIYKVSGTTFTKLTNPTTLPTGVASSVAFSPDGNYLAVGNQLSPFLTIYARSGDTFTKIPDTYLRYPSAVTGITFSPDSQYLSITVTDFPYILNFKRTPEGAFDILPNPDVVPPPLGRSVSYSPDGIYLAVGCGSGSAGVTGAVVYKKSGDVYTKLTDLPGLITNIARGISFNKTGEYVATALYYSPYISIFKRSGDSFTQVSNPNILPSNTCYGVNFSANDAYLTIAAYGSERFLTYQPGASTNLTLPTYTSSDARLKYYICTGQ